MTLKIAKLGLRNQGGFAARIAARYSTDGEHWTQTKAGPDVLLGGQRQETLSELGAPEGAAVQLVVEVLGGYTRTASEVFTHQAGSPLSADYMIAGTTLNSFLAVERVGEPVA